MNRLITAIHRRILLASALLMVAAVLSGVIYFKTEENNDRGCATRDLYTSYDVSNINGQHLFQQNCASCHHPIKDITGPALQEIEKRFPMQLLHEYIRDPKAATKKSKYLRDLEKKYGIPHPAFSSLTNAEIDSIFDYSSSLRLIPVP